MFPQDPVLGSGGALFTLVPLLVALVFVFVIGSLLVRGAQGVGEWHHNNQQSIQTLPAIVVAKRAHVAGYSHHNGGGRTRTTYFATFELADGTRHELQLPDREYGLLAENDRGSLTFQGSRFHAWQRMPRRS